jgi:Ca2+-binding RTX toxin-like protein
VADSSGSWRYETPELELGSHHLAVRVTDVAGNVSRLSRTLTIAISASCRGREATLVGSERNDRLEGTDGPDVIAGLGGDDVVEGLEGDDIICGGEGADTIRHSGSTGINVDLDAGTAIGAGFDIVLEIENVVGTDGDDVIVGSDDVNELSGGKGTDEIHGGGGNDVLLGNAGRDLLDGGDGEDTCSSESVTPESCNVQNADEE